MGIDDYWWIFDIRLCNGLSILMDLLRKIGPLLGILTIVGSIAVTFGMQMERLSRLQDDVKELKATIQQVMLAVGTIEHSRWKDKQLD